MSLQTMLMIRTHEATCMAQLITTQPGQLPLPIARRACLALAVMLVVGCSPAQPDVSWDQIKTEIQRQYSDVTELVVDDGLLMIRVQGDWSDAGAVELACSTIKPILTAHGVGGQEFAIYDHKGAVIATGNRCP
jgi:hypothetical protein